MLKLYQSYLSDEQKKFVSPAAIPWCYENNTEKSKREYELFKEIYFSRIDQPEPWGLVSSKFANKCVVPIEDFIKFADQKFLAGFDCVFINPMIGNEALHSNVWDQGISSGHHGLGKIVEYLETWLQFPISVPMGKNVFAFCNYFIATPYFWNHYFAFVDHALKGLDQEVQKGTEVGAIYKNLSFYTRDPGVTMKPFVIERLFSVFIQNYPVRVASYIYQKNCYEKKFGSKLGTFLFKLSALKHQTIKLQCTDLAAYYNQIRSSFASYPNNIFTVSNLDDPPDHFASPELARFMNEDISNNSFYVISAL